MSLDNVHPKALENVQKQLPQGAVINSAMSTSETSAVFMIEYQGKVRRAPMSKVNVGQIFNRRPCEIDADDGETWASIMERFSTKYNLHMLPGVDYVLRGTETDKVSFSGAPTVCLQVTVEPDSVSLYGTLLIVVKNKAVVGRPKERAKPDLVTERLRLALTSKVFSVKGSVFTGSQLTSAMAKAVIAYLKPLNVSDLTVEELGTSKVEQKFNDGVSGIAAVKPPRGPVLLIRYAEATQ